MEEDILRNWVYRYLWFTIGVIINAFGVAIITKAALGTSPISSVPYVLSLRFPWSLGQFTFVFNLLFIAAQAVLRGRDFPPIQFLQIALCLSFAFFHGFNGLGLGTVVSALIVGRFVNLCNAHLPLITRIRLLRAVPAPREQE